MVGQWTLCTSVDAILQGLELLAKSSDAKVEVESDPPVQIDV
jgi:hypothetical protein